MKPLDLVGTAVGNTFRSKTRTILTILAIFIGAFTLTITNGLGTGINRYIDDTVAGFGASDVLTVTKADDATAVSSGPQEYDPDSASAGINAPPGTTVTVLTAADLDALAGIDGVTRVQPVRSVSVDYIQFGDGTRYSISASAIASGQTLQLAAGAQPDDDAEDPEVAIPASFIEPLGFGSAGDAVGQSVTLAVTDATGVQHTVQATVSGVAEETFSLGGSGSMIPNDALTTALYDLQQTGLQQEQQDRYIQAYAWFAPGSSADDVTALQDRLTEAGFASTTVEQQLGTFKAVIDGIVLVLNAFAIIALLAASFGIINTLFMSVQERTREIGLMKAMGMGSGRVFSLFSIEATFIGFLGSALGVVLGMLAGAGISGVLGGSLLSDLPGLQLIAFDATSIISVIVLVMVIAFLAGTLPAARAARQDPVESLRYE